MPVLPRVVHLAAVLLAVAGLVGCSQFDAALGQQQAIVSFHGGTSTAQRLAIRTACAKAPEVSPRPVPDLKKYPYALQQVTFTISKASDAQIAALEKCLQKFPAVAGVTIQDSSDTGS
ncbi:MAG TPA: hypothetical protein VF070_32460 [Streptosporangiaceae bacterium]